MMQRILMMITLMWFCTLAAADSGGQANGITIADQPLQLIRAAAMYQAGVGLTIQPEDILETGKGTLQIELVSGILLLGPNSRLFVSEMGSTRCSVVLLSGWIKIVSLRQEQRISVTAPFVQITAENGAAIVHAGGSQSELFVESGSHQLKPADLRGVTGSAVTLKVDQFTVASQSSGIQIGTRASREFISQMPLAFRDQLRPVVKKISRNNPTRMHELEFAEIQPWLKNELVSRKVLAKQLTIRFKDPEFYRQFEADLGQVAEWKNLLRSSPNPVQVAKPAEKPAVVVAQQGKSTEPTPIKSSDVGNAERNTAVAVPTQPSVAAPAAPAASVASSAAAVPSVAATPPVATAAVAAPIAAPLATSAAPLPAPVNPIALLNAMFGPPPPALLKVLNAAQGQPSALEHPESVNSPESNRSKIARIKQHQAQPLEIETWLKDAEFRRLFDAELGQSPEWKSLLHPGAPSQ